MTRTIRLKPCPASGEGVHKWICYAACTLVEAGMSDEEAENKIEALMTREPNPHSEIEDALATPEAKGAALSHDGPL